MSGKKMTLDDALDLAIDHQKAGRLQQAEAVYQAILEAAPNHPIASHNQGLIALRSGRPKQAVALLEAATRGRPDLGRFHNSLGEAYRALARHADAVAEFEQAALLSPTDPAPHNNRGVTLATLGRLDHAEQAFRGALARQPDSASALSNLGNCLQAQGRRAEAIDAFQQALAADPADLNGARLALSSMGAEPLPDRASEAQLERLYAMRSGSWDDDPNYRAAVLVADALRDRVPRPADILDIGCGTGLVGGLLKPVARTLVGVDLSPSMLQVAAAKGVYTALHQADLLDFLGAHPGQFDAVACAATLIHFSDLSPAFKAAASALRPAGAFALTLFPNERDPDAYAAGPMTGWAQGGLFTHGRRYVSKTAQLAGFQVLSLTDEIHEQSDKGPVTGLLVVLGRQGP